jgi:cell division protein FtsQ
MGARKISRKQDESQLAQLITARRVKLLVFGSLLMVCGLFIYKLYLPATLPFKKIQVYGTLQWVDREKLNALVLHDINGGFFSLDVMQLKQNLEQLAWIESVSIRRVWPDVLQLMVSEQQPVALWNGESIINQNGGLFMPAMEQLPDEIVHITGPEGMYETLVDHYNALSAMTADLGLQIANIDVNERRAMKVTLSNGVQLFLGRVRDTSDSGTEMMRFVRAYKATLAPQIDRVQFVDLRYTNGVAVRWKQQVGLHSENSLHGKNNLPIKSNNRVAKS